MFDRTRIVAGELRRGINFKLLMTSARKSTEVVYKTDTSEQLSLTAGNAITVGKSEWAMAQENGYLFLLVTILARGTRGHVGRITV